MLINSFSHFLLTCIFIPVSIPCILDSVPWYLKILVRTETCYPWSQMGTSGRRDTVIPAFSYGNSCSQSRRQYDHMLVWIIFFPTDLSEEKLKHLGILAFYFEVIIAFSNSTGLYSPL